MTDNITPQVLQAKAPMTTEEIIGLLETVKIVYPVVLGNAVAEEEIAAELEALTAAIQAVGLLEQIEAELRGECAACENRETGGHCPACQECIEARCGINWEWRWPPREEADHENK